MNREQFKRQVKTMAESESWMVYDTFADTYEGFADMILVGDKVLFVMLMPDDGVPSNEQVAWQESITAAGCIWVDWRPCDWEEIREYLASSPPLEWDGTKFYLADM